MTWPVHKSVTHGVCGHIYEVIDYYLLLKDFYNVGILIGEEISYDYKELVLYKYDLSESEIDRLIAKTIFANRPRFLIGENILFVDGLLKKHFQEGGVTLRFKNILTFRCSPESDHENLQIENVTVLQDQRIYKDDKEIAVDYIKKINFSNLHKFETSVNNVAMIYGTGNCRAIQSEMLFDILDKYCFDKYIYITNLTCDINHDKLEIYNPPVPRIFKQFNTYIYTPIMKRFDCSPRFIAECDHYGKHVIYHDIDDEYLNTDLGLKYRKRDIQAGLNTISLTHDDQIIEILNEKI